MYLAYIYYQSLVCNLVDTLRVVSQTSSLGKNGKSVKGLLDTYRSMKKRGLTLFAGVLPALGTQGLLYASLFSAKVSMENLMTQTLGWDCEDMTNKIIRAGIAGAAAGVLVAPLTTPMELIKIRLQTANSNIVAMGVNSGLANLTAIGMFRGLGATCIRCGFGNAGFFAYLEAVDLHREKQQPPSDL